MAKKKDDRETTGTDGLPLPILPPERDARVWARMVRVVFYTPGFMGLLLIKTGEPASFGITVELLMLSAAAAIVGGLFIGAESSGAGADSTSRTGTWSGCRAKKPRRASSCDGFCRTPSAPIARCWGSKAFKSTTPWRYWPRPIPICSRPRIWQATWKPWAS